MGKKCVSGCTAIESDLCKILTSAELKVIHDERDVGIIARIKAMSSLEFNYFKEHRPKPEFVKHYIQSQCEWIKEAADLLWVSLGREPSKLEIARDYHEKNALRFRVYYALKYPNNVEIPGTNGRRAS
jgi:hypothetical protein